MAETDAAPPPSKRSSSAREAARAEERMDGASRRLADIEREIHDMLEVEPDGAAEIAELEPEEQLPPIAEIEENLDSSAATASGWARSICAPRKSCAKSKPSTPS